MSLKRDSRAHRIEQLENRRLLSGGALDTSFSMDGLATATQSGFAFSANDAAVRSDGKIIVAGTATMKNHSYFFVARYNAGGSLDKTFGAAKTGIVTQDVAGKATGVALTNDNRIVVVGATLDTRAFLAMRYTAD